jgi:hypothetical protein
MTEVDEKYRVLLALMANQDQRAKNQRNQRQPRPTPRKAA